MVVGIDGSEHSKQALAWAARYAALAGTPLIALAAWEYPANYGWTFAITSDWDPETDARETLEREASEVLGSERRTGASLRAVQGLPGTVLVEASDHASLLVVGGSGRGELAGKLLGSVSTHVTNHAHCPVVVVRYRSTD